MGDGESRWNATFVREFAQALDDVEASAGPVALITTSASEKCFSNGLDLDWVMSGGNERGGDGFGPPLCFGPAIGELEPHRWARNTSKVPA